MEGNLVLPESVRFRTEYKRKFSLREMYRATVFAPGAMSKLIGNKKRKVLDQNFVKRLQLAVTEVNGCALCSYGHAKMALRQGMNNDEINSFLSEDGGGDFIRPDEAKAIVFAQHFADSKGWPKQYAYESIVEEYGQEKASIILSATQMMLVGNMYGIPMSAFLSRLKGKRYADSSLVYELKMQLLGLLILPIAIAHGFIRRLVGLPNQRFDKSKDEA